MTTEAYIRDPRFEALLIGWATPDGKSGYVEQSALPAFLADVVPGAGVIMHHAHFDGLILSHHFGVKPAFIFDTLSMGRQLHGTSIGLSLAKLAEHYSLSPKTVPYDLFIGRNWAQLDVETRRLLGEGAAHDCALTMEIFRQMLPKFPKEELLIVDTTVRMFTEPCLIGDAALFAELRDEEFLKKNELLYALDVGEKDLASADKFCAILEREGVEIEYKAGKNGDIPAIASTDQFMRDMAAGVYGETAAFLAEARLNVKSTIAETRCGRLHEMSTRGPLPVYLNYCGCHTTRWSGGDKSNMQNMPRGSRMRTGVKAPDGFLLCPTDQEQGEARVVNWLGGQEDVLENFRQGKDPYVGIASKFYGFEVTKAHKKERGTGKQLELSCLGPDTLVLTASGPKPIVQVTLDDQLWDGVEWVSHQGLLSRGKRTAMRVAGLWVTPQHGVLCGNTWAEASNLQNENTLSRALATGSANLPSQATWWPLEGVSRHSWSSALAGLLSTALTRGRSMGGALHAATFAPNRPRGIGLRNTMATLKYVLTMHTAAVYSGGLPTLFSVAEIPNTKTTPTTAGAALACLRRGVPTEKPFSLTSSHSPAGTTPGWTWIGKIIRGVMSLEILGSSPTRRTATTDALSKSLKRRMNVYDIACSGPRNRFTVATGAGWLIVHNCGFGAGAATIIQTAKRGTYGPPVYLTDLEGERAKSLYRDTHPGVVALWKEGKDILRALSERETRWWGPLLIKDGLCVLPNGGWIDYSSLEWVADEETGKRGWKLKSRKGWTWTHGAKLVENVVQALSRVITSQAMIKVRNAGYHIVMSSHDDFVPLVPIDGHEEEARLFFEACMSETPAWAPGLPLAASGKLGATYD